MYEEQAESFLGFKKSVPAGLGLTNIAQSAHVFANQYRLLSSAVKTLQVARKEELRARKEELRTKTDANAEKHSSEPDPATVDTLLEALWNYTVMDVESTLRTVCTKVFKDSNVPFETRVQRAEGVLLIGQIFIKFGKSSTDGLSEVLAKFH